MLILNPDVILDPKYVEKLVDAIDRRPEVASVSGKLLRVHDTFDGDLREPVFTDIIDSAGLRVERSRRAVERGGGKHVTEAYERSVEVFGVSGAAAMYRLSALEDVAYLSEFFDEDLFAYKEDLDIAWRLRLRGWTSLYVPQALAYHYRAARGAEKQSIIQIIRERKGRSAFVSYLSYRNHALVLMKNEQFVNALLHLPWILWYEFRKFLYVLFLEPGSLKAIPRALGLLPRMWRKRKATFSRARVPAKELRKWFSGRAEDRA
jgi:GT2 family glycosyltransferase